MGSKETACTTCIHREVCALKNDFLAAQEAVDNMLYKLDLDGNGVKVCDIPFIKPVDLKCKYYLRWETKRDYTPSETAISTKDYAGYAGEPLKIVY